MACFHISIILYLPIVFILQAGSVYGLKAMIAKYVRELTLRPSGGIILKISSGQPGLPGNFQPTLLHIVDMLKQAGPPLKYFLSLIFLRQCLQVRTVIDMEWSSVNI